MPPTPDSIATIQVVSKTLWSNDITVALPSERSGLIPSESVNSL
uniref:Uncharacterized protein n=1 Tax=Ipomoea trifida TaxID=35884 RepID=A0A952_IPOTF|nr:hypothetical protein [Ipomoea trifida]